MLYSICKRTSLKLNVILQMIIQLKLIHFFVRARIKWLGIGFDISNIEKEKIQQPFFKVKKLKLIRSAKLCLHVQVAKYPRKTSLSYLDSLKTSHIIKLDKVFVPRGQFLQHCSFFKKKNIVTKFNTLETSLKVPLLQSGGPQRGLKCQVRVKCLIDH